MVLADLQDKRNWQPREQRLLSEFLALEYPHTPHMTRVRLGTVIPEEVSPTDIPPEARLAKVFKRWADAVILLPEKTIIVEAKIRLDPGVITKLRLYEKLFRETPEFKDRWKLPIEKMLVYAIEDPVTIQMAREDGIRAVPYTPNWIPGYLRLLSARERRAPVVRLR